MQRVKPEVYLVGETKICMDGLSSYLCAVGAPEWSTNASSDAEKLVEVMGRLCYKSYKAGLNPNVSKIREGNDKYLENILRTGHGSVLEHATTNWIFRNVSRVFTHELVRHRVGVAISQESLRYVRLQELGLWLPPDVDNHPGLEALFERKFESDEQFQREASVLLDLDNPKMKFSEKKKRTSTLRRGAPIGLATSIGFSMNFRSLRHLLVMRTDHVAEVEIRTVFAEVGKIARKRWPNIFLDFEEETVDNITKYTSPYVRIQAA